MESYQYGANHSIITYRTSPNINAKNHKYLNHQNILIKYEIKISNIVWSEMYIHFK